MVDGEDHVEPVGLVVVHQSEEVVEVVDDSSDDDGVKRTTKYRRHPVVVKMFAKHGHVVVKSRKRRNGFESSGEANRNSDSGSEPPRPASADLSADLAVLDLNVEPVIPFHYYSGHEHEPANSAFGGLLPSNLVNLSGGYSWHDPTIRHSRTFGQLSHVSEVDSYDVPPPCQGKIL